MADCIRRIKLRVFPFFPLTVIDLVSFIMADTVFACMAFRLFSMTSGFHEGKLVRPA